MATLTAKEIAARFGTDARTLRKFLRSDAKVNDAETPGKGSRYAIEAKSVKTLQKRFDAWNALKVAKGTDAPEGDEGDDEVIDDTDPETTLDD